MIGGASALWGGDLLRGFPPPLSWLLGSVKPSLVRQPCSVHSSPETRRSARDCVDALPAPGWDHPRRRLRQSGGFRRSSYGLRRVTASSLVAYPAVGRPGVREPSSYAHPGRTAGTRERDQARTSAPISHRCVFVEDRSRSRALSHPPGVGGPQPGPICAPRQSRSSDPPNRQTLGDLRAYST